MQKKQWKPKLDALRENKPLQNTAIQRIRISDSRIQSVIRIATKIVSLGPWAMPCHYRKFRQNPFTSLRVIRRTKRQTDRQTDRTKNTTFFGGGNNNLQRRDIQWTVQDLQMQRAAPHGIQCATNMKYHSWKGLECWNDFQGHSRSLQLQLIDRPYTNVTSC